MKNIYYKEINIARAIGIIMVVLFHSSSPDINTINFIKNMCNTIQMPLFFFISGFVAFRISDIKSTKDYGKLISNKFKRLIIPYLSLGLLLFLPKLILNKYAVVKLNPNSFIYELLILGNNPITFLWFLYALFLMFVIYTRLINKNAYITFILNLSILILLKKIGIYIDIFRISTIIHYANYFILGFIVFKHYVLIKKKYIRYINSISIITTFVFIVFLNININSIVLKMIVVCIGIVAIISISILLSNNIIGDKLEYIGKYTYDIYLLSWFGQNVIRVGTQLIGISLKSWTVFIGMFIGGLSVFIISKYILRNNEYTNKYILGNN